MKTPPALLHLDRMLEAAEKALAFTQDMTREEFLQNSLTQHAVAMSLLVIGEAANRSRTLGVVTLASDQHLDLALMAGLRNRIAHGYFDLDFETIWEVVQNDLPMLVAVVPSIIAKLEQTAPSPADENGKP